MSAAPHPPRTAVVFAGGDAPPPGLRAVVPVDALVIAADSGLHHARRLGVAVDVAVGDFDSVDADALARAAASGTSVESHPVAKDATDLELALDRAVAAGVGRVVVVGGHGGRLDHFLANALLLASPRYATVIIEAHLGAARLYVVRDEVQFHGRPGDVVSLLALHGPAHGVRTAGLQYPLAGETLHPGSSRGVSNVLLADRGAVQVGAGVLLVVLPGDADGAGPLHPPDTDPWRTP